MVGAKDGGVSGQVVEVIHDDGHEEIDHDEAAEEDEADEVEVGGVAAAALLGVEQLARGVVARVALLVARPPALARQHDVRPRLARGAPAGVTSCYMFVVLKDIILRYVLVHCMITIKFNRYVTIYK